MTTLEKLSKTTLKLNTFFFLNATLTPMQQ